MAQAKPYQSYQKIQVKTSNQQQLIVMLYEGMNRFLNRAAKAIDEKDFEVANNNLQRTGKILLELLSTLREDLGGEVARNLKSLYVFCYEEVVTANLTKDKAKVLEISGILNNLSSGWKEVYQSSQSRTTAPMMNGKIRVTG